MTSSQTFKKGSALVEGAIIFPLILMVLLFHITMARFLLMEVLTQSILSRDVLSGSITLSSTGKIEEKNNSLLLEERKGSFYGITGDDDISLVITRLLKTHTTSYFHNFKYVINEMDYIRWIDQSIKKE